MSLIVGQFARQQLDGVRMDIGQHRENLHHAQLRGIWTSEQIKNLNDLIKSISMLELAISSIILDNQPTGQQKRL